MKEETLKKEIFQLTKNSSNNHQPYKDTHQQSCTFCLTRDRFCESKRTSIICIGCFQEKKIKIHLCLDCFPIYHQVDGLPVYEKNEKKTNKCVKAKQKKCR